MTAVWPGGAVTLAVTPDEGPKIRKSRVVTPPIAENAYFYVFHILLSLRSNLWLIQLNPSEMIILKPEILFFSEFYFYIVRNRFVYLEGFVFCINFYFVF